jgi:phosphoglycolate phosphatase
VGNANLIRGVWGLTSLHPDILTSSHSRFRLIVFDLDGTLVDSLRDLAESANALLDESACEPLSREAIGRMVGDGAATLVARAFAAAGRVQPPGALARFLTLYNARLLKFTRPYPGMLEALAALSARATLAVLTNKPLGPTREILDGLGLAHYFRPECVVGGDGPFARKPDPAGLFHLVKSTGAAAVETILVGDSIVDWRTARAARTAVCLARYGFGFQGFPLSELGSADLVADQPGDLLDFL